MPVYKDEKRKSWYVQFYYTDYTGARKQKRKRGFATQREAKEYEREFLNSNSASCDMTLNRLIDIYIADRKNRVRDSTVDTKLSIIDTWIRPYLGNRKVCEITALDVRKWQDTILEHKKSNGEAFKPTYQRSIHAQLSAIFNYAVRFYHLPQNPCKVTGTIGKSKADAMQIWTLEQYQTFSRLINRVDYRLAFDLLFYGGFRCGELLAFFPGSLTDNNELIVKRGYRRKKKQDILNPTKNDKDRKVPIPSWLAEQYRDYCRRLYGLTENDRIFPFSAHALRDQLDYYSLKAGLPRIRLHDLRHSNASYLIDQGATVPLVAERLGDTIQMVMKTYAHLYPQRQLDIVEKMEQDAP